MHGYKDLHVYRRAYALAIAIHGFRFVNGRAPGLSAQLKRSVQSISANIAEGYDRTPAEFARYLRTAISESRETEHHLRFGTDVRAIVAGDCDHAIAETIEIRCMLFGLLRHVRSKSE